jgi:hypothetical protein
MPGSSEFRDAFGGCDRLSVEINFEAMIKQDWMSNWTRSTEGA